MYYLTGKRLWMYEYTKIKWPTKSDGVRSTGVVTPGVASLNTMEVDVGNNVCEARRVVSPWLAAEGARMVLV